MKYFCDNLKFEREIINKSIIAHFKIWHFNVSCIIQSLSVVNNKVKILMGHHCKGKKPTCLVILFVNKDTVS
jgi:hypothetical protein